MVIVFPWGERLQHCVWTLEQIKPKLNVTCKLLLNTIYVENATTGRHLWLFLFLWKIVYAQFFFLYTSLLFSVFGLNQTKIN